MRAFYFSYNQCNGGRNNTGRITVRHRGKSLFPRRSFFFPSYFGFSKLAKYKLFRLLGHAGPSQHLGMCSKLASKQYQFATLPDRFSTLPNSVRFGSYAKGTTLAKLYTVPLGSRLSYIQVSLNGSAKLCRAPGSFAQLLRRRGSFVTLRLPSGEVRRVHAKYFAFSSSLPAKVFSTPVFYKAGQPRSLGRRPSVRGCAINPVDHPHGGRTGESRPSVSPWGILTKGYKTRTKPLNSNFIIKSVQSLKQYSRK